MLRAPHGAVVDMAGFRLCEGVAAKDGIIAFTGKLLLEIAVCILPCTGRLAALAVQLCHLQLERDRQVQAQIVFADNIAAAVHPVFAVRRLCKDGVSQRVHGNRENIFALLAALLGHGARRHCIQAALWQRLCHFIAPRHAVGGISLQLALLQTLNGITPGVACFAALVPHHGIAARRHFFPFNGVALAGLGVGIAADGKREVIGPRIKFVAVIVPALFARKLYQLAPFARGIQEGGAHGYLGRSIAAAILFIPGDSYSRHTCLVFIRVLSDAFRCALAGHAPGVIAAQIRLVFRDGVLVFRPVRGIDVQIFKPQRYLQRGAFVLRLLIGLAHLSRAPRQALHGLWLRQPAVRLVDARQHKGDGRKCLRLAVLAYGQLQEFFYRRGALHAFVPVFHKISVYLRVCIDKVRPGLRCAARPGDAALLQGI